VQGVAVTVTFGGTPVRVGVPVRGSSVMAGSAVVVAL